jgi:hypothetical protein
LAGSGIDVVDWPWYDRNAAQKVLKEAIGGRRIAADVSDMGEFDHYSAGLLRLPDDFGELRWSLDAGRDWPLPGRCRTHIGRRSNPPAGASPSR